MRCGVVAKRHRDGEATRSENKTTSINNPHLQESAVHRPLCKIMTESPNFLYWQNHWIHLRIPFAPPNSIKNFNLFALGFSIHTAFDLGSFCFCNYAPEWCMSGPQDNAWYKYMPRSSLCRNLPEDDEVNWGRIIKREDCWVRLAGYVRMVSCYGVRYRIPFSEIDKLSNTGEIDRYRTRSLWGGAKNTYNNNMIGLPLESGCIEHGWVVD